MKSNVLAMVLTGILASAGSVAEAGAVEAGKLRIFLSDPDLGVVGSYSEGGQRIYFEASAATAGESSGLGVRLLDAGGRTIASAGHSTSKAWSVDEQFDASAAQASQKLALTLAARLSGALVDPVFKAERVAIANLAARTAEADLGLERVQFSLPKAARTSVAPAQRDAWYQRLSSELVLGRERSGDVLATFRDTRVQAFKLNFPTELDEEGKGPRVETYARVANDAGVTLSAEYGGDLMPTGWMQPDDEFQLPADVDDHLADLGEAVAATQLLARATAKNSTGLSTHEGEAFSRLALGLRENLLPRTDETRATVERERASGSFAKAGGTWSSTNNKSSNSNIWKKNLGGPIAEHSANRTSHYTWPSRTTYVFHHDHRFCNHGGCPLASNMTERCQFSGNFHSRWYEAPQRNTTGGSPDDHSWHSCATEYDLLSGSGPGGGHNCHDDTWTQLHYVNLQTPSITSGRCNDSALHRNAPSCTDSGSPR